ncbi:hypothetical protein C2845_PM09G14900 [Panicum miliaceum]|uniref:Uncharacterized protein n=1 Tax=Panicum miliaceum TaxID=4540 RepID=A0A3L6RYR0_PANMI|nr:hypothetical protein C2845_PM09G14900 [Panicum miliaceum]
MESVTHDPATFALHCRRGALRWLRLVLGEIGINPDYVKLLVRATEWHAYLCHTATLIVLPDLEILEFEGKMTHTTSTLDETAVQSAARKMMKILLTKSRRSTFDDTPFRLFPRTVSPDEDPGALDQEGLTVTRATGSYLADPDHLVESRGSLLRSTRGMLATGEHSASPPRGEPRMIHTRVHAQLSEEAHGQARIKAEEELQKTEKELRILRDEKVEWENKEKGYVTTINKLVDRVTDREAVCRSLQGEVDDLQDYANFRSYLESRNNAKDLKYHSECNKWNIAMLTHTAVFYRDKAARALQTWELSDTIRTEFKRVLPYKKRRILQQ